MPVLVFNHRHFDLNLINEHLVDLLADKTDKVKVGKNADQLTMFMSGNGFWLLDIVNYLRLGTSYKIMASLRVV